MKEAETIKRIIKEAKQCNDIDKLLDYSMTACGFLIYLHEQEADAKKLFADCYNERKYKEAEFTLESESGVTKAQSEAIVKGKQFRDVEAEAERTFELLRGYRNSVSTLCDVLAQKISHLKKQYEINSFKK